MRGNVLSMLFSGVALCLTLLSALMTCDYITAVSACSIQSWVQWGRTLLWAAGMLSIGVALEMKSIATGRPTHVEWLAAMLGKLSRNKGDADEQEVSSGGTAHTGGSEPPP